ncbi:hypothetical protein N356_gp099 [Cellulophaga phage phi14:2]|uniref:Uncharacterized protein n=1 Tax=Cellulophaga phage phi14:2 TaxID=1327990 RepID=S0A3J4_9CAUD|nr:hypothetical protein N356_gp099 [Cellulophaga phage phi14:2]AGO48992.1 hypothetical protein Phi14:2_gp114 [Cellulophaga phage phi14:2]
MSKNRGASLGRKQRRGKIDAVGRPLQKRPFSNSKRTRGTKGQEEVKQHYTELMNRLAYIKHISALMKAAGETLNTKNWLEVIRKYETTKLFYDDYEKNIIFSLVNQ